jgi:apolipoprotein N-acyltransferase
VPTGVAFRRGWLFGWLFILGDLAWVIVPATAHLGPLLALIALAIAALEALPIAIAAWAFARADGPLAFCLGVPALYALLEAARAGGPLGLPLATLGATQTVGPLAITLAIGGVPLATFVALVAAASLVFAIEAEREHRLRPRDAWGLAIAAGVAVAAIAAAAFVWHGALAARSRAPLARIGIVEAGPIDVGRTFAATANDYAAATQRLPKDVDFALWPEGVVFLTAPDAAAQLAAVRGAARAFGRPILAGATLRVKGTLHNDVLAIDARGNVSSVYTKRRLVPFGEYQPFAIGAIHRATYGAAAAQLNAPVGIGHAAPFGALICYEVAFPDLTRDSANAGAGFLIAVLNDTWFAGTDGPAQLAQLLAARAIESGIAIVRVDAVPPSGAVDADGAWIGTPLTADGVAVIEPPPGIVTPFRRTGEAPYLVLLGSFAIFTLWPFARRGGTGTPVG